MQNLCIGTVADTGTDSVTCANAHPDCLFILSATNRVLALQSRPFIWKCIIFHICRCRRYIFMNNSNQQWGWREYTVIMCISIKPWSTLNFIFGIRKEKHQHIWLWFDIKRTFYFFKYFGNSKFSGEKHFPVCRTLSISFPKSTELMLCSHAGERDFWDSASGGMAGYKCSWLDGCLSPLQSLLVAQKSSFWRIFWSLRYVQCSTKLKLHFSTWAF